jgi:GAF domain-containing protein/HAMP domain-containing protein
MQNDKSPQELSRLEVGGKAERALESIRRRNAFWVGGLAALAALILLVFDISLLPKYGIWQMYVLIVLAIVLGVGALIGMGVVWNGRVSLGSVIILGILMVVLLAITSLTVGTGLIVGLAGMVGILVAFTQILPTRQQPWGILAAIMLGVGCGLFQVSGIPIQVNIPEYTRMMPLIGGTGALAALVLLAFGYRSLSITTKFTIAFLLVVLVVAGVLTYFTQRSTSRYLTDGIGTGIQSLVQSQAVNIGDAIESQVTSLYALSQSYAIQYEVGVANQGYETDPAAILNELNRLDEQWRAADAAGNNEDELVFDRLTALSSGEMLRYQNTSPDNVETFVTDYHGGLVAATNRTSDYNQSDEGWWRLAFNNGDGGVYVGAPEFDQSSGKVAINIAVPVKKESGDVIGILRTTYQISAIQSMLAGIKLGKTGAVDIYFPGAPPQRMETAGLDATNDDTVFRLLLLAKNPYAVYDYDGVPSLVSVASVASSNGDPVIAGLGWFLVGNQQTEEALAPVREQLNTSLLLAIGTIALVSLGAILLSQLISGPIIGLTSIADKVRSGDLNVRARVTSFDEVGDLATTFNQMTDRLRVTLSSLEQRVAARTHELTVAGDVGRVLSQERELDTLLKSAVESIASAFGLYYAQIYLLDPSGRTLVLRAGSGEVGTELLRRGHRLPATAGSINGLAVADKRPVLVPDTAASPTFRPNPLLPDTRSEMAVPLLIGSRAVGVLDIQSTQPGALSEDNLFVYQALAGQLAISIDNASLFQQAQRARMESETQALRLSREGWQSYLDGITRSEQFGFAYDAATQTTDVSISPMIITPEAGASDPGASRAAVESDTHSLEVPIQIVGETLGGVRIERGADHPWTQEEADLVAAITNQIGRQIDNLRLLEQADQYRREAELAVRRQARAGWDEYLEAHKRGETQVGYVYDRVHVEPEVNPAVISEDEAENVDAYPMESSGEKIGEVVIEGVGDLDAQDRQMLQDVMNRLSTHLETLRLADQTRLALKVTEELYAGSEGVVRSATINDVLRSIIEATALRDFDHGTILLFSSPWQEHMPDEGVVAGTWERSGKSPRAPMGTRYDLRAMGSIAIMERSGPVYLADTKDMPSFTSSTTGEVSNGTEGRLQTEFHLAQLGRSIAIFPLVVGEQWIGWMSLTADQPVNLTEADLRQVQSLTGQAAAVVQSIRLLDETQASARREQALRQFTQRVRSAIDPEQVLRTAAREVGQALGRNVLVRLASEAKDEGEIERT